MKQGDGRRKKQLYLIYRWETGRRREHGGQVRHEMKDGKSEGGGEEEKEIIFGIP